MASRPADLAKRFGRSTSGMASVEFGLLGTVLLLMFAGSFDISYMVTARRDSDRASMLLARVLVSCPDTSCAIRTMDNYYKRRATALVRYPDAEIGMALIQRTSGAVKVCAGNMTYLEGDIDATAKNIMKDDDVGAAVYIRTTYTPMLPKYVVGYIKSAGAKYRDYTVDVRGNGGSCL